MLEDSDTKATFLHEHYWMYNLRGQNNIVKTAELEWSILNMQGTSDDNHLKQTKTILLP